MSTQAHIRFLFQPARALSGAALEQLARDLSDLALRARPDAELPAACEPGGLVRRVLAVARTAEGDLCGMASARLLPVPGLGEALHLEEIRTLGAERERLAERLALATVRGYCLRFSFPARLWCVFDSSGPCRVAEPADAQWALDASCAVDEAARRWTRPAAAKAERWAGWLGEVLTPVARFELEGRVLETGFVGVGGLIGHALRRRTSTAAWSRARTHA